MLDFERFYKLNESYTEILRLDKMLTDAEIPHTLERMMNGWQVIYYKGEYRISDAVEHYGSYGESENLLEIMGLTENEDDVEGYLTAEDVFRRYYKDYYGKEVE